jgi:hypothetical protein
MKKLLLLVLVVGIAVIAAKTLTGGHGHESTV